MENNNLQPKNGQTADPQKFKTFTVIFIAVLILNLLINIGISSYKLVEYQKSTYDCQTQTIANSLSCKDARLNEEFIIIGIKIIIIAIFSLAFWLLWKKKGNINNYKKLLIIYIIGFVVIFLCNYFIIWVLFYSVVDVKIFTII